MKKNAKKMLVWSLVFSMAIGNLSVMNVNAQTTEQKSAAAEKNVLWSSGFEKTDDGFKQSVLDEKGSTGVSDVLAGVPAGSINYLVDLFSVTGSADFNDNETKKRLFDGDSNSKFLTNVGKPVTVEWSLTGKVKKTLRNYKIVSANDSSDRDPKTWTLSGKAGNGEWVEIDSRKDEIFKDRFQTKTYEIDEKKQGAYDSYQLVITERFGDGSMTQFADILMETGDPADNQFVSDGMYTAITNGPSGTWNQASGQGWSGSKALEAGGSIEGDKAHSYNVIYDGLNTPVTADTYLEYTIFPSMSNGDNYDFDYTQMYMSVDLKFSDGTYLSDLKATDQNQNGVDPISQGKSRTLTTNQWNRIYSNIGEVAKDKTINEVLIDYKNDRNYSAEDLNNFKTFFDDITIYTKGTTEITHLSDYTYVLRGTNDSPGFSRGLTAPAIAMPHGFNFWAPATNSRDNKIYDYQDTQMRFMTISHEPSYWVGDRGTWQFMVNTSEDAAVSSPGMGNSKADFSHENEIAHSHYYSVEFDKDKGTAKGSKMELTPTEHGAVVRFTYDDSAANRNVIFDCVNAGGGITFNTEGAVTTFTGYSDHKSNGSQRMFVYGSFDAAAKAVKMDGRSGIASFDEKVVEMKIATSYISEDQAKKNLELEIKASEDFDDIFAKAQKAWDDQLGVISDVKGATYEELVTLYSNLYRLFAYPNIMSENTGTNENPVWKYKSPYRGAEGEPVDGKIYINNGFWDTYRTTWAAYALLTPGKASEMLDGLVQHFVDQDWVPRWIAPGGTDSMVGTSSDVIFADAVSKGIDFNEEDAYASAIRNAATVSPNLTNGGRKGLETGTFLGYAPGGGEKFSWSMEGYVNDYGIARMAKILGDKETNPAKKAEYEADYQYYSNRARNYVKLFNKSEESELTSWFRGREANGDWTSGNYTDGKFDPYFWGSDYTETNAYNMTVSVVQDGQGLANLYGGNEKLANKIDSIMQTNGIYNGYGAVNGIGGIHEQKEAREVKLGQYGHSNQPSHHIIYMYNYAEQPWKTQKYVRDVLDRCYTGATFGQGYLGDEDNGEMSAWYILSALGFYPVTMGSDEYAIGSPLFDEVTLNLESGKSLVIKANNNSKENVYVQSMKVNGKDYTKSYIKHNDLINAGTIEFNMGSTPNTAWGVGEGNLPTSMTQKGETPAAYNDIIRAQANVETGIATPAAILVETLRSDAANAKNLIDNTANTETVLADGDSIYYSMDKAKKAEMFTLTSGSEGTAAPAGIKVYGANNGGEWVELAAYDNLTFRWSKYTRPFIIPTEKQGAFEHYKFTFTAGTVAEVELLSYDDGLRDRTSLGNLIQDAKSINMFGKESSLIKVINQAIKDAEIVYAAADLTSEAYTNAYETLKDKITVVRDGTYFDTQSRIEAEDFTSGNVSIDNVNGKPNNIGGGKKDYFAGYKNVFFRGNVTSLELNYAAQNKDAGGYVEIYIDGTNPENMVGKIDTPTTGAGWSDYVSVTAELNVPVNGVHDLYLVLRNDTTMPYVANIDYFKFSGTYNVTAEAGDYGTVSVSNPIVEFGGESQISIQAASGYFIKEILVDGQLAASVDTATNAAIQVISNIKDNVNVSVKFWDGIILPENPGTPPWVVTPETPPVIPPTDEDGDKEEETPDEIVLPKVKDSVKSNFAKFIVTKTGEKGGTLTFTAPASRKKTAVNVPSVLKVNGLDFKVTAIANNAFKENKAIKTIAIGKNLKTIGTNAFYNAKNLKKITIKSANLTKIGSGAFKGINKKAVIYVPAKQYSKYVKMLRAAGLPKTVTISKI